jgi:hypothetical protein
MEMIIMTKSLVIYYSRAGQNYVNGNIVDLPVGNTEIVVDYIKELTGADTFKVETVEDYPVDYMETTEVAQEEQDNDAQVSTKETTTKPTIIHGSHRHNNAIFISFRHELTYIINIRFTC